MNADAGKNARESYLAAVEKDKRIQALSKKIGEGRGTYADADALASRTGKHAGRVITDAVLDEAVDGRLEEEVAAAILQPTMAENHKYVADLTETVQKGINRKAGNKLGTVRPELNQSRIDGLAKEIAEAEDVLQLATRLTSQIENASMAIVDDSVSENFNFQHGIGLSPKIVRTAESDCCKWCAELEGEYEYEDVKRTGSDVYRRHDNCRCTVEFVPGDGSRQNVHTKRIQYDRDAADRRIQTAQKQMQKPRDRDKIIKDANAPVYEDDIIVHKGVGAKAKDIMVRLPNGEKTRLTPNTKIEKVQTIAGAGKKRKIDEIDVLTTVFKDTAKSPDFWKKKKGMGYVDYHGESYRAEIHWYNHPITGDVRHKVKPDAGGNWFYDED